jgi:isocitrate dehydrogenase
VIDLDAKKDGCFGEAIKFSEGKLDVPSHPVIPYIRGDGIGVDVTPVMRRVIDAAIAEAYNGERSIVWLKVLAGEESLEASGVSEDEIASLSSSEVMEIFLPEETFEAIRRYVIAIKGPMTTPVGGGFRSLNVTLRHVLKLFACVRPVKWYEGVPAPLRHPERLDVVIFRENMEDVYSGIEWPACSDGARRVIGFLDEEMGVSVRMDSAIGVKPISITGSKRLVRAAINYALRNHRRSVTLVHKGNVQKYTEGGFRNWGYEVAIEEYRNAIVTESEYGPLYLRNRNPDLDYPELLESLRKAGYYGYSLESLASLMDGLYPTHGGDLLHEKLLIKDRIADQMFQQLILRPAEYEIIATTNLNGDYLSDACAAEVGGLGIAPGANIDYESGLALFEATHGSAPRHAGLNRVNPTSLILSGVMMLRYLGWVEAADFAEEALVRTFRDGTVTYDLHRQMEEGILLSTSDFGEAVVKNMNF